MQFVKRKVFGITPPVPPSTIGGRLRVSGRFLSNDNGTYRALWSDALTILSKSREQQIAFIDWTARSGFNGVRVFAGVLTWAGQTLQMVYDNLPFILAYAGSKGLYVEVTAITDSATGYDIPKHISAISDIVNSHENAIIELANEPYHGTQNEKVHDPAYLESLLALVPSGIICALGAAVDDESDEFSGGHYVTAHLDRGRDKWNMVRRVRELENLSAHTAKFVMNNEPIKFGSQMDDPAIAFTMSVLDRGFEVGGVLHFDDGLFTVVPEHQQVFADAWVNGFNCIQTKQKLQFSNAGWIGSPVASANFETDIIRAYSFLSNEISVLVEVGVKVGTDGGIVFQNGYSRDQLLAEVTDTENARKCRVFSLKRG